MKAGGGRSFDVGIAIDGDSDRLGVMDEHGEFVTQLQTFALLYYYQLEVRGERGDVVRALTTTRMVDRLAEQYGTRSYETAVGFKFVGPKMLEVDALLGGEESGGYAFRGHLPERDGIIAGLFFLDLVARTGQTPTQLLKTLYGKVGEHHYDRVSNLDGYLFNLRGGGWLLIRFSGTEPLMRIYTEVPDRARVPDVLEAGKRLAGVM
jgi:phosphomannomutase